MFLLPHNTNILFLFLHDLLISILLSVSFTLLQVEFFFVESWIFEPPRAKTNLTHNFSKIFFFLFFTTSVCKEVDTKFLKKKFQG